MQIHLLDMGAKMYGDCILVVDGATTMLVDGAHPGDDRSGGPAPAIQDQLAAILGTAPPFAIDLLVVTHCHSDHIGCLPELYARRLIQPRHALLADEKLGFGRASGEDAGPLSPNPVIDQVVAALREEPRANPRSDAELATFLADAAALETRYGGMVRAMIADGVDVARYGRDDHAALVARTGITGLQVVGPSVEQLVRCADAIARSTGAALDQATTALQGDAAADAVTLYRRLAGGDPAHADVATDAPGKGAALNDQSIVVIVGDPANRCLLAGDMQFAAPETSGLDPSMQALRRAVSASAPFAFVKLPHHGSYNGVDAAVLAEWRTGAVAISTGSGDSGHPSRSALTLLKANAASLQWARTDRNGRIRVDVSGGKVSLSPTRGQLNDASPNTRDDASTARAVAAPATVAVASLRPATVAPRPVPPAPPPPSPPPSIAVAGGTVEVVARIPNGRTRVTLTIDVDPFADAGQPTTSTSERTPVRVGDASEGAQAPFVLAPGRRLDGLLFVTDRAALGRKIGADAVAGIVAAIEAGGQTVADVGGASDPLDAVHRAADGKKGVVIVGGYDVVPAFRFDVLPPELRRQIGSGAQDNDGFIVWSDQPYVDVNDDQMADIPVSRIPDGGSAELVRRALAAPAGPGACGRFGVRNLKRPFADAIYAGIAGSEAILLSEPCGPKAIRPAAVDAKSVYFMLHGSDADATRFWGETYQGDMIEAFSIENLPEANGAVVFAGCCWGALTVEERANRGTTSVTPRTPGNSIALAFLAGGARAFVGCTGTHYSPVAARPATLGGPMHTAFFAQIAAGKPPAQALYDARVDYLSGMPYGSDTPGEHAIEYKILRQFTCLGLGW